VGIAPPFTEKVFFDISNCLEVGWRDTKWIMPHDPKSVKSFFAMISVEQIRAARGLLGWSQSQLAGAARRSLPTIKRLEREDGEGPAVSDDVRLAVKSALERAGVVFIPENGGGAGVRLRKPRR
jgi:hypothetical protein